MLKGSIPVIPTPFSLDGSEILYDRFAAIIDNAIQEGAASIMIFGGGGEFYKLTARERGRLLKEAIQVCKGKIPVVATVTQHATRNAIQEIEAFQKAGADVINVMPPSFAAPSGIMIRDHIIELSKVVKVPMMIQYAPALTGSAISNEVFAQIADSTRNELYIKAEAVPTGPAITSIMKATGGRYSVIIGNAGECLYEALDRGAVAVMPGAAFVKPYCDIMTAFEKGDKDKAFELYMIFLPYLHFIQRHIEEFVSMEKLVLQQRGLLPNAVCRMPAIYPDNYTSSLLMKICQHVIHHFY
ncbi:MAG: dihydrodipicolinate synthase family protein [Treponema sp.]|jgi:4-hydroxy-tetrahydrodipicolinate synthase|nr:dihydrodipicolinate synthase family protein [Treponema sp.]